MFFSDNISKKRNFEIFIEAAILNNKFRLKM